MPDRRQRKLRRVICIHHRYFPSPMPTQIPLSISRHLLPLLALRQLSDLSPSSNVAHRRNFLKLSRLVSATSSPLSTLEESACLEMASSGIHYRRRRLIRYEPVGFHRGTVLIPPPRAMARLNRRHCGVLPPRLQRYRQSSRQKSAHEDRLPTHLKRLLSVLAIFAPSVWPTPRQSPFHL